MKEFQKYPFSVEIKNTELISKKNQDKEVTVEKKYLVYFDVRFRMSAHIKANSVNEAIEKIYDIDERDLIKFDERDAPEITTGNVFEAA